MSRDKKTGIVMLVTVILSVVNTIAAFAIGAWTAPTVPLSAVFMVTQIILGLAFIGEVLYWTGGP